MLTNIRFYIILSTIAIISWVFLMGNPENMVRTYALLALAYLYLTLMASPVARIFTFLPYRGVYLHARRALGFSAFLFAACHVYLTFFVGMGGFAVLPLLSGIPLWGTLLGLGAITILTLLAATAFDVMVNWLTFPRWKMLHRLVYLAAIFILIHAKLFGSDFQTYDGWIPTVFTGALVLLFILEAIRFYRYLFSGNRPATTIPQ